jgi:hypothetical protein
MTKISYAGYRFPSEIIQQAIWLYLWTVSAVQEVCRWIWQSVGCSYLSGLECGNCRGP